MDYVNVPLQTLLLSQNLDLSIQETEKLAIEFLRFALDERFQSREGGNTKIARVFQDLKFMSGIDLLEKPINLPRLDI